ncbi:MAG: hypothetical protein OES09_04690 [Gammaproteobacteria bacterium]|nr:hypothetical protein [Gammaproteobacteria bacterium]
MASASAFQAIDDPAQLPDHAVPVDTRPLAECTARSLRAARCLPAREFLFPDGRLTSFRGILWLLGTAGLDGSETVVVFGKNRIDREFVAGVLFLSGQARVVLWNESPQALFSNRPLQISPGRRRGMIRDPIYTAWMRESALVLRHELIAQIQGGAAPVIVDGRAGNPETRIRGAVRYEPQARDDVARAGEIIVYAESPRESIALFTRLQSQGIEARVYADGWHDWPKDEPALIEARDELGGPVRSVYLGVVALIIALLLFAVVTRIGNRR